MKNILKILLSLILFLCITPHLYSTENFAFKKTATTGNAPTNSTRPVKQISQEISSPADKEIPQINSTNNTNETKDQEKKVNEGPDKSWWLKFITDPVATFTGLLFLVTFGLWWATYRLVIGAKKTAEQQLRAYVFPSLADGEKLFLDESGRLCAPLIIKNYGQTPAYKLRCSVFVGRYKLPLIEILDSPDYDNGSLGCLAPNQVFRQYPALPRKLSQIEEADIKSEVCGIYVWGYLEYVDIFKIQRKVQFRMISTGDDFDRYELAYSKEGNEAT
jgi:hypothetical protein